MSEKKNFVKSAGIVSLLTFISRILGLLRDAFLANRLGYGVVNDIFNIAFEVPNLLRRVLGEGSLSAIIVPIFSERLHKEGKKSAFKFASNVFNVIAVFTFVITVLGMTFSKYIFMLFGGIRYYYNGEAEFIALGTDLVRIMFPFLMFLALSSLLMGILHSFRHFVAPSLGSIVLNLSIITASLLFRDETMESYAYVFAWAVLVGIILRFLILIPPLMTRGLQYSLECNPKRKGVRELLMLLLPAFYGLAISQINVSVDKNLATWIGPGSVTFLTYSNRLVQFPLAIIASALATSILPSLTKSYIDQNKDQLRELIGFSMRILVIFFIPAMIGFLVLGYPIIEIIFQRGKWDAAGTSGTYFALIFYSVGLLPFAALRLLIPVFYAKKDMITPVKTASISMVVNIVLNLILMRTRLRYGGLALATSIAAGVNAGILIYLLRKDVGSVFDRKMLATLTKTSVVAIVMGVICRAAYYFASLYLDTSQFFTNLALTLGSVILGIVVFLAGAKLAHIPDLKEAEQIVLRKLKRSK